MERRDENIGFIAAALYAAFGSMQLFDEGALKREHRFSVGDGIREQVLIVTYGAVRDLEPSKLGEFVTSALEAMHGGAQRVKITVSGATITPGH